MSGSVHHIKTPVGTLAAVFSPAGLKSLSLINSQHGDVETLSGDRNPSLDILTGYLKDYFDGKVTGKCDISIDMSDVTPFRRRVFVELMDVGFGEVVTYGELADRIGSPRGSRAVGGAVGSNPFLIIIPCHRVVASSTSKGRALGGFGAGLDVKRFLLRHEGHADDMMDL